jgi:hypothetical protein
MDIMSGVTDTRAAPVETGSIPAFARLPVLAIAGGVALLLSLTAGRYGFFGDELYFIAAGHHLAWGYADQPPLVPLLARAVDAMFPGSVVALRIPAMVVTVAGVVVTALAAREFGGQRRAQTLAAAAIAISWQLLVSGHLLETSTVDPLFWEVITWLVVRWIRTRNDWLLLWSGAVTAIDLQVKYLIPAFWIVLGVCTVLVGPRDLLRRPMLWIGMALAVLSTVPSMIWQSNHGWPQWEMGRVIAYEQASAYGGRPGFLVLAVVTAGFLAGAVLLCYGLWQLLRSDALRPYRVLGWTVIGVTAICVATEGHYYYASGLYSLCWAAGAVGVQRRRPALWWRWSISWVAFVLSAVVAVPLALPIFPQPPSSGMNLLKAGTVGWPKVVDTVAAAYRSLPSTEQHNAVLLTRDYWQAAAIDYYGPERGLPRVYSAYRGYWYFGAPPADSGVVLYVGPDKTTLAPYFDTMRPISTVDNPGGFPGINNKISVWLCSGQRVPWTQLWPKLREMS